MSSLSLSKRTAAGVFGLLSACATVGPPPELVEARSEYARVASGIAPVLTPNDLLDAREHLDQAERLFQSEGDAQRTRDAAYVATRKALFAESSANTAAAIAAKGSKRPPRTPLTPDLSRTKEPLIGTEHSPHEK